ncbi:MAG TPA: GNAT family N-acetyltransferase [Streptosporangiaceae bacterium]|nr:GNAT family N-acetyltransferase [Streptosporangiaceae bacterium]
MPALLTGPEHQYVQITDLDPADEQALLELHELGCACDPVDRPHVPPPTLAETTVELSRAYPGSDLLTLLARVDDGRLAGYASLALPVADNTANALVDIVIHPDLRRRGVGTALAAATRERLRAHGRTVAIGFVRSDSPGVPFAAALGAREQVSRLRNILYLDTVSAEVIDGLLTEATTRAAGYELARMTGSVPGGYLEQVAAMYEVMNDAPLESGALEDEKWTPERVADADDWLLSKGDRVYTILATRTETGQPAGMTRLAVRAAGDLAVQLDTAVAAAHRGRRLGNLMKATMLRWLMEAEPQVRRITTFNAASNVHMIAVNKALGFVPVERWISVELAV